MDGRGRPAGGVRSGRGRAALLAATAVLACVAPSACSSSAPGSSGSTPAASSATSRATSAARAATSFEPEMLTVAPDGTVYASNCDAGYVYAVSPSGKVTVFAGTGVSSYAGGLVVDGSRRQATELDCPAGLVVDPKGRLLVADHANNRIRAIDASGLVTTVVGVGPSGTQIDDGELSGDGGPALSASLQEPEEMTYDGAGNLYVADRDNHVVRRVAPSGVITTVVGDGDRGFSGDGGPATKARLDRPSAVAVGSDGTLYVLDGDNSRVRAVGADGVVRTLIVDTSRPTHLGDGGPVAKAHLDGLTDLVADRAGNLYIAESGAIRMVDRSGTIRTVAGTGRDGCSGLGGPATRARITAEGLALGADGTLYVAGGKCGILRLGHDGTIQRVAHVP